MKLIAITGSIGCGKTTIANILREYNQLVYDVDKWVRFLYYKKDFLAVVEKKFPEVFIDGVFDKRKLRTLVFNDNKKLKVLEGLIHPFLTRRIKKIIRKNAKNDNIAFVDVALLFEMGWDKYFDYIILADVDEKIQKERVMKRDNISEEDFYKINNIQMPRNEKIKNVDFIINTEGSKNILKIKVLNTLEDIFNYADC